MPEIATVGLDLVKNVFQLYGADGASRAVLRKKLRRDQALAFFTHGPCKVVQHGNAAMIEKAFGC
jgi:transposase